MNGKALRNNKYRNFWRYRNGDYRIVVTIENQASRIIVLRVAHRRDIYRKL